MSSQLFNPFFRAIGATLVMLVWVLSIAVPTASGQPGPLPDSAKVPLLKLRIVGGLGGVNQYTRHEQPFWSQQLSRLSAGNYAADIVPIDQSGVPGQELLRLVQLGVVPFGTILQNSLLTQYPQYAANNLAGLSLDMPSLKKAVAAFRPYLEAQLRAQNNIELLALYTYPAQVVFCKAPFYRLADLKARRVRVASVSQADFVTALGALPVLTGFAQIVSHMASGNIDCAITGAMSGNTLGLHEQTSYIHTLPIAWGMAIFVANKNAWDALPTDLRDLLKRELPQLESAIWAESERETTEGLACNAGLAQCLGGRKGNLVQVDMSQADQLLAQDIFTSSVLPGWLARCKANCAEVWNQTLAPVVGIVARPAP